MKNYIEVRLNANPCTEDITDLLAAFLADVGYDTFSPDDTGLTAYIVSDRYDENQVQDIVNSFPISTSLNYSSNLIEGKDWNEEWEKNYFKPILIERQCVVHSSFHQDVPSAKYDIIIDPKMAFGTGHHSTTLNMIRHILDMDLEGKSVIDMGTGTGILGILAKMKGAGKVTGIDIDEFAIENARENIKLNNTLMTLLVGDKITLEDIEPADIFIANINRNIIVADLPSYVKKLKKGATILLSGFYKSDIPIIMESASKLGLIIEQTYEDNEWVALRLVYNC